MEALTKTFLTKNGPVEGIQTRWPGFSILMVTGSKGFLACPAIDIEACQRYGAAGRGRREHPAESYRDLGPVPESQGH
jgi:uncharacterized protein YunC (DUF1805 family)